jgi:energy-coupling factor transporter ATP-binding protein EcfA2
MQKGLILEKIERRVAADREEGDIAYFNALLFELEFLIKLTTSSVIACLGDDTDRSKYSLEYEIVRANSIGTWVEILNKALTGPSAQFFNTETGDIARDLTERVSEGDWRYESVYNLSQAAFRLNLDGKIGNRVALRQFFEFSVVIRNRTRGHGAMTASECGEIAPLIQNAITKVTQNLKIFNHEWAYIHRNLSGKYRISVLNGSGEKFNYLKSTKEENLNNGIYIYINHPLYIPYIYSTADISDIYFPNGNYKNNEFEILSLITNEIGKKDGSNWSTPPGRLPASHTEGLNELDKVGNTFTNLPKQPTKHITRQKLEEELLRELLNKERHPIITLTGPGGIGKTTLTLVVADVLTRREDNPYDVILWISSRDVDLLDSGPKPVAPRVVTKENISKLAVELLDPSERKNKDFIASKYFEKILSEGAAGSTLFILDNFETIESPVEVFRWIDTYIRHPNKILITTRFRDFQGDFPIEISGMNDTEAKQLIDQEARRLGIYELITATYSDQIINESDGHPYVIKILLGQVSNERRAVSPKRIIANADSLLTALFERTYTGLRPAAQRVFLLLSSWMSYVPTLVVEAVSIRSGNERFDVSSAIDELRRYSLIDEVTSETNEDESFVGVPRTAASFGRKKLEASPYKLAVEEDRKILMEFGPGGRESSKQGVFPRVEKLVAAVAKQANENPDILNEILPILEYIATKVPQTYLRMAELIKENSNKVDPSEKIKDYLRAYLEFPNAPNKEKIWFWLSSICHESNDVTGEIHALTEIALNQTATVETMGIVAEKINNRLRILKDRGLNVSWSPEVKSLIERTAELMYRHLVELDAQACSRLAWLYLNIGNPSRARDIAKHGISKDLHNEHCIRILERLEQ